jgi:hypothetical protein
VGPARRALLQLDDPAQKVARAMQLKLLREAMEADRDYQVSRRVGGRLFGPEFLLDIARVADEGGEFRKLKDLVAAKRMAGGTRTGTRIMDDLTDVGPGVYRDPGLSPSSVTDPERLQELMRRNWKKEVFLDERYGNKKPEWMLSPRRQANLEQARLNAAMDADEIRGMRADAEFPVRQAEDLSEFDSFLGLDEEAPEYFAGPMGKDGKPQRFDAKSLLLKMMPSWGLSRETSPSKMKFMTDVLPRIEEAVLRSAAGRAFTRSAKQGRWTEAETKSIGNLQKLMIELFKSPNTPFYTKQMTLGELDSLAPTVSKLVQNRLGFIRKPGADPTASMLESLRQPLSARADMLGVNRLSKQQMRPFKKALKKRTRYALDDFASLEAQAARMADEGDLAGELLARDAAYRLRIGQTDVADSLRMSLLARDPASFKSRRVQSGPVISPLWEKWKKLPANKRALKEEPPKWKPREAPPLPATAKRRPQDIELSNLAEDISDNESPSLWDTIERTQQKADEGTLSKNAVTDLDRFYAKNPDQITSGFVDPMDAALLAVEGPKGTDVRALREMVKGMTYDDLFGRSRDDVLRKRLAAMLENIEARMRQSSVRRGKRGWKSPLSNLPRREGALLKKVAKEWKAKVAESAEFKKLLRDKQAILAVQESAPRVGKRK